MKMLKQMLSKFIKGQKGQVLPIVLVLLVLGGLVIAPTLRYASTSLKTQSQVYETNTLELYSADSGVGDAMWRIQNDDENLPTQAGQQWTYDAPDINGKAVNVTLEYIDSQIYKITSTGTSGGGGSTTIESYIESIPGGNLDIFSGALASKGNISLKTGANITGDMYYVDNPPDPDSYEHIKGDLIQCGLDAFPTPAEDEAFAQSLKNEASIGGTSPALDISSDTSLGPLYIDGNIYISGDIALNLTGTVYVTGSVTVKKDFTLTGTGSLIVEGDIYLSKIANFGTDGDSIIMSLYGNITFKKGGIIEALIYAPNGTISFDKSATVIGGVVGANIDAKKEGSFTYIPSATPIEYPGSLPASLNVRSHTIS